MNKQERGIEEKLTLVQVHGEEQSKGKNFMKRIRGGWNRIPTETKNNTEFN